MTWLTWGCVVAGVAVLLVMAGVLARGRRRCPDRCPACGSGGSFPLSHAVGRRGCPGCGYHWTP